MWFKKSKEIKRLKEEINELNYELIEHKGKIEVLKKENKELIEDFAKNYHYVLTVDKNFRYIHLYQDGQEIKYVQSIEFEATMDSIPTFNIEVH